jgi:hypothetical protein
VANAINAGTVMSSPPFEKQPWNLRPGVNWHEGSSGTLRIIRLLKRQLSVLCMSTHRIALSLSLSLMPLITFRPDSLILSKIQAFIQTFLSKTKIYWELLKWWIEWEISESFLIKTLKLLPSRRQDITILSGFKRVSDPRSSQCFSKTVVKIKSAASWA